jgi:hypothetical protein
MAFNNKKETRSPIKQKPLRNPGQSLDREIERLLEEEIYPYLGMVIMAVILAAYEWLIWLFRIPPQPINFTAIALAIVGIFVYKLVTVRRRIQDLLLGLEGEKFIGQFLEQLRVDGCQIFHDIPGEGFNIDHVIISPHGIFVVETKTRSKPVRGEAKVYFDGDKILVNGIEPDRDAIAQVLACKNWLQDLLFENTSIRYAVKPAIIFPEWYVVDTQAKTRSDIWVLNHKAFVKYIANEPIVMKPEDVALAASRLRIYVQNLQ